MRAATELLLGTIPDDVIDGLGAPDRRVITEIWRARAGMERHVAAAFGLVVRPLVEAGASVATLDLVSTAVSHEIEHGELCLALAARYAGEPVSAPPLEPVFVPDFATTDPALRATLWLIGLSCLNETIASVRLAAEIEDTSSPTVRRVLTAIAADETIHARAGWAHLASPIVGPSVRAEVNRLLPSLVRASIDGVFAENAFLEEGYPDHGLPSRGRTMDLVAAALRDVVIPGFTHVGLDSRGVREQAASRFPNAFT